MWIVILCKTNMTFFYQKHNAVEYLSNILYKLIFRDGTKRKALIIKTEDEKEEIKKKIYSEIDSEEIFSQTFDDLLTEAPRGFNYDYEMYEIICRDEEFPSEYILK
jgi:hypothetical protein